MEYHLDYGLRLSTNPQHESLYSWAINEIRADGSKVDRDQIPWAWTLTFTATSCILTNQLEIKSALPLIHDIEGDDRIDASRVIQMRLRPGSARKDDLRDTPVFSMFGTKRTILDFVLQIRPLKDAGETERCTAWGSISYTFELDFAEETTGDCLWFYLAVKPDTFRHYAALIERNEFDSAILSVGSVEGFYSDWSPRISTDSVKVLLSGAEHALDLPPDFEAEIPRLGRVHEARLILQRHIELTKQTLRAPEADGGYEIAARDSNSGETVSMPLSDAADDPAPTAHSASRTPPIVDSQLLPVLVSLKRAAWLAVILLAAVVFVLLRTR